ncbi:MAG: TonB-dependent receptor, partial [Deltaproteobacteria bacterium]|nr:TonB-dependent receptor [Deltaproteobacteria bacterium]
IGVSYLPLEWLKLRANYSEGFRMPTSFNLTGGTAGFFVYLPNPNLRPEESKTLEFGIDVDYKFFTTSLTYFKTDWENKIIGVTDYDTYATTYQNLRKALITGIEFSIDIDLGQAFGWNFELSPYLSYTYLIKRLNKDPSQFLRNGDDTLPNTAKWTLAYGATFNYPDYDLMANFNAIYRGPQIFTWPFFYDTYHVITFDFVIEKGIWNIEGGDYGKIKIRAEINNLFDNCNEVYYDYPGPGRNFYIGLIYEF